MYVTLMYMQPGSGVAHSTSAHMLLTLENAEDSREPLATSDERDEDDRDPLPDTSEEIPLEESGI